MALEPLPAEVVSAANDQSQRLRELLRAPTILVMPGAYDVLSARLFESLGFSAIQGTSGGIAAVQGLYDEELLGRARTAEVYRAMVAAVAVPVNADGEKGYGGVDAMGETVRQFVGVGLAGMNLEDSDYHPHGWPMTLVPLDLQLAKIRACEKRIASAHEVAAHFEPRLRARCFGFVHA